MVRLLRTLSQEDAHTQESLGHRRGARPRPCPTRASGTSPQSEAAGKLRGGIAHLLVSDSLSLKGKGSVLEDTPKIQKK